MKKHFYLFVSSILVLTTLGCAKGFQILDDQVFVNGPMFQKQKAENLAGKSIAEVLKLKYDKAVLKCDLWTQRRDKLDISLPANDSVAWDLKSNEPMPNSWNLNGQDGIHKVEAEIKLNSLGLQESVNLVTANGTRYKMSYTPFVNLNISYKTTTTYPGGPFYTNSKWDNQEVREKVNQVLLNDSETPLNKGDDGIQYGPSYSYINCVIDTEIKPEYQEQFVVEAPKN